MLLRQRDLSGFQWTGVVLTTAVALMVPLMAIAQTPPSPKQPDTLKPPQENAAPPTDPSTDDATPLTKELKEGEGVLEPPRGIDPEIQKPVPPEFEGKTPVIPPPGATGGDPNVQPK